MDQDLQNYYKLTLSHDLIVFLMNVFVNGLPKEQKVERSNKILEAWEKRIEANVKILAEQSLEDLEQEHPDEKDVLRIIQNIHTTEPVLIRKEYKREVRHTIFKSFDSVKE